jgi:hypothetical protein
VFGGFEGGWFVGVVVGGVWPVAGVPVGQSPRVGSQLLGDGLPVSTVRWQAVAISAAAAMAMAKRMGSSWRMGTSANGA